MARIKMHIPKAKLPFYPPCEVKCRLQNEVSTKGKEDFEETINEIDREIQRFDLPYTNENAPTASPQNLTKDKPASI